MRGHVDQHERARVNDDAGLGTIRLDTDRAREHRVRVEPLAQHGEVIEPVEQRQHETRLGLDAPQRRVEAGGLGGDDQDVYFFFFLQLRARTHARVNVAKHNAMHRQPPLGDRLRGGLPRNDDHVDAARSEQAGDQPTHATGAEHRHCHAGAPAASRPIGIVHGGGHVSGSISTPGFIIPRGSTAAFPAPNASANGSGRWRSYQGR